jgi:hypothetical protein
MGAAPAITPLVDRIQVTQQADDQSWLSFGSGLHLLPFLPNMSVGQLGTAPWIPFSEVLLTPVHPDFNVGYRLQQQSTPPWTTLVPPVGMIPSTFMHSSRNGGNIEKLSIYPGEGHIEPPDCSGVPGISSEIEVV